MAAAPAPRPERRKQKRISPQKVRAWLVSGEFDELYTTVNFARSLVNLSPKGACVETTGRLRPDVKMSIEVRFDELSGALRSETRAVWTETVTRGGQDVHLAGLRFQGPLEATQPVRDFLEGARPAALMAQRRKDYEDLKRKSDDLKRAPSPKKWGLGKKLAAALLVLALAYAGSFAGLVYRGRIPSEGPSIRYRYGVVEETAAKIYAPALALGRMAGIDLVYVPD